MHQNARSTPHRHACKDIYTLNVLKTLAVFVVSALLYANGWV